MHKGLILLVKCYNKNEAIALANNFMTNNQVGEAGEWFDSFSIGGRWKYALCPIIDKFQNRITEEFGSINQVYTLVDSKNTTAIEKIKAIWKSVGGIGNDPYSSSPYSPSEYSCMLLGDSFRTVKECRKRQPDGSLLGNHCLNVFNISDMNTTIPTELNGWYAVMIDYEY